MNHNISRKIAEKMPWLALIATTGAFALAGCGTSVKKVAESASAGPVPAAAGGGHNTQPDSPSTGTSEAAGLTEARTATTTSSGGSTESASEADKIFSDPNHAISPGFLVEPGQTVIEAADKDRIVAAALRNMQAAGATEANIETFNQAAKDGVVKFYDEGGSGDSSRDKLIGPNVQPAHSGPVEIHIETAGLSPTS